MARSSIRPLLTGGALLAATGIAAAAASAGGGYGCASGGFIFSPPSYAGCDDAAMYVDPYDCETHTFGGADTGIASFAWVVIGHRFADTGRGISELWFGVEHDLLIRTDGTGNPAWALCTGGDEIPTADWPESGSANHVTWAGCAEPDRLTAVGFLVIDPDAAARTAELADHPAVDDVIWKDCDGSPFFICGFNRWTAFTDLGGHTGCGDAMCADTFEDPPPCTLATPVIDRSWGSVKSLFD